MTKLTTALALALAFAVPACTKAATCPTTTAAAATTTPPTAADATALRIKLTKVYVDDQEKALRFYTDILGFVARTDESNGGYRWLTVAAAGESDGTELQLASSADPAAKAFQQALYKNSEPAAMFYTDDVDAAYARMKAKGATFTMPPTDVTFAKIATVDDTCGNLIQLTQLY